MPIRHFFLLLLSLGGSIFLPNAVNAQMNFFENNRNADVISQRVEAQADLIRSQGDAYRAVQEGNLYYAKARVKLAEAIDKDLDNWLKHVRVYYERRSARLQGQMALREEYSKVSEQKIAMRRQRAARVLDTLQNEPKYAGAAAESGNALNAYLDAFASTPLGYGIELSPSMQESVGDRLRLDPETLQHLRVRGRRSGGGDMVFRLGQDAGMDLEWWPSALRQGEFDLARQQVEQAREQVVTLSATGARMIDQAAINALEAAVGELSRTFFKRYPPGQRQLFSTTEIMQIHRAEDFLARLDRDVLRISEKGNASALSGVAFDPETDGRDASTLIAWMIRNGLQFEECQPGDEAVYRQVFTMMRELNSLLLE